MLCLRERGGIGRWERWAWIEMQAVVSGMGGFALVYVSVCVCDGVMVVIVGSVVSVRAKSKRVNSLDKHKSANITATHSSTVHSQPHDRHSPCCSVEVASKDRARILALTENTVSNDLSWR